jgi:hypothetical protein
MAPMVVDRLRMAWILTFCGLSGVACGRHPAEPEGRPAPSAAPSPSAPGAATAPPNAHGERHLAWSDPPGFTRSAQTSPMRLATYLVPRESGDTEDGELAVFHFSGGQRGDVEANLARWEKQFSDTKESDVVRGARTMNGLGAHVLRVARGTYTAMTPGQSASPKAGYAMIAAVVETPLGSYVFKLTGPAKTVMSRQDVYFTMLDSVHIEG